MNDCVIIAEINSGGPRTNMVLHNINPRIPFEISQPDPSLAEVVPCSLQNKAHILVSLMQDYRQGTQSAHSMSVTIGFCIYQVCTGLQNIYFIF